MTLAGSRNGRIFGVALAMTLFLSGCSLFSADDAGARQSVVSQQQSSNERGGIDLVALAANVFPSLAEADDQAATLSGGAVAVALPASSSAERDQATTVALLGPGPNVHLWRASLEVLSFMPMALADPVNGLIQTDWHVAPGNVNERMRVEVYVLSDQLRTDALRVNIYRQTFNPLSGQWADAPNNPSTARQLENQILQRARDRQLAAGEGR